ncbi:MAG: isoprenyl transferase [Deltaproteobacteria bacterium]|jgi:undecaprenyl diphosphate synthase|nr:isoprenyl transferase [Deltaproteobacteria bacterium]
MSHPGSGDPDLSKLPSHIAIIMDGNGRWAKQRLMNRINGHEKGADAVRRIVRTCREIGIDILTLYAFSTENWQRPKSEVAALMDLLKRFLKSEAMEMQENNIRLNSIGQMHRIPKGVRSVLQQTMDMTASNTGLTLNLALSYGGRAEIVEMVKQVAGQVRDGRLDPSAITPEVVSDNLYTRGMCDPDLLIRTGGDMRVSNFLLWQIAYAEIFVTDTLWPDFSREEFMAILDEFRRRERRFGRINQT